MSERIVSAIWQPCWKLTTADHTTQNGCQWGRRVENPHGVKDGTGELCSRSWYHGYDNAYLAVLMNSQHANIEAPTLWRAEWRGSRLDDRGLKFGATEFRTIEVVEAPVVSTEQLIAFAILCAAQVWDSTTCPTWDEWAQAWLAGENRNDSSAANAANAAYNAANAAYNAAYAAANAAYAAYNAAYAAANAAAADYAEPSVVLENAIAWALTLEPSR